MTTPLAIAATSEVLRFIIESALTEAQQTFNFAAPRVTVGAPPRLPANSADPDPAVVNLFLHSATPNPALRSFPGPARDEAGRRLNNAPLVLDLQYLLSAHGPAVQQEIGLGTAMHALHQVGIIPRNIVRDALASLKNNADPSRAALAEHEPLADQLESLKVATVAQDIDALTKIWTATQAPMRPSAAYLVTAVFLENTRAQKSPLPVLTPTLAPAALRSFSAHTIAGRKNARPWPLTVDAEIVIAGEGLTDRDLTVTLSGVQLEPVTAASGPEQLVVRIPAAAIAQLRAGPVPLTLALSGDVNGRRAPIQSSTLNVLLRPDVARAPGPAVPNSANNTVTGAFAVMVTPPVERTQRVTLRLTGVDGAQTSVAVNWTPPAAGTPPVNVFTKLTFALNKVPKGDYLLQLEVDGVVSQPMPDGNGVFQPRVTL